MMEYHYAFALCVANMLYANDRKVTHVIKLPDNASVDYVLVDWSGIVYLKNKGTKCRPSEPLLEDEGEMVWCGPKVKDIVRHQYVPLRIKSPDGKEVDLDHWKTRRQEYEEAHGN